MIMYGYIKAGELVAQTEQPIAQWMIDDEGWTEVSYERDEAFVCLKLVDGAAQPVTHQEVMDDLNAGA